MPPPQSSVHVSQAAMAPVQSTGQEMSVLHGCVSTSPAARVQAVPPLLADVAMMKDRVCTPLGPQVSVQAPKLS